MTDYFPSIIGLEKTKGKLAFFLDSYFKTGLFPNSLFVAPKGCGKTHIAVKTAQHLKRENQNPRPIIEINCSTIKNLRGFLDEIIMPHVFNDKEITLLFDECCEIPKDVSTALLTILNPNDQHRNTFNNNGVMIDFDFRKQTFLFMTSESHKVFHALEDRLEKFVLEPYSTLDLAAIIRNKLKDTKICGELLNDISKVVRGNPRQSVKMANKILSYLRTQQKNLFEINDWAALCGMLDILPLGLTRMELEILKILNLRTVNLTNLSAILGLSPSSVRRDHELYLLKKNLIQIESGVRKITPSGRTYLDSLPISAKS